VVLTNLDSERRQLYRWQLDALISWLRCGRRGVVEAVTGSGKTDLAIAAASDALRRGHFVLVVVPSRVLMEQWHGRLIAALPGTRIGRLGDSGKDTQASCDVLVATRHSAAAYKPVPPDGMGGLLIADECHGLGGATLRRAILSLKNGSIHHRFLIRLSQEYVQFLMPQLMFESSQWQKHQSAGSKPSKNYREPL